MAKTPKQVLYKVHPLDGPDIRNDPRVEDADYLPAVITHEYGDGRVDLEVSTPVGTVAKTLVEQGNDSDQWHVGPEAPTTADGGAGAFTRTAFDDLSQQASNLSFGKAAK